MPGGLSQLTPQEESPGKKNKYYKLEKPRELETKKLFPFSD